MLRHVSEVMTEWEVYLNKKHIDTVFYLPSCELEDVRSMLINHDGFDPDIELVKREKRSWHLFPVLIWSTPAPSWGFFMNTFNVNGVEVFLDTKNKHVNLSSDSPINNTRKMKIFKYLSDEGFLDAEPVFNNKKNVDSDGEPW